MSRKKKKGHLGEISYKIKLSILPATYNKITHINMLLIL